jgi:hypothetical protein
MRRRPWPRWSSPVVCGPRCGVTEDRTVALKLRTPPEAETGTQIGVQTRSTARSAVEDQAAKTMNIHTSAQGVVWSLRRRFINYGAVHVMKRLREHIWSCFLRPASMFQIFRAFGSEASRPWIGPTSIVWAQSLRPLTSSGSPLRNLWSFPQAPWWPRTGLEDPCLRSLGCVGVGGVLPW